MIKFPSKRYSIIYADPPWEYKDKRAKTNTTSRICGGAINYYSAMSFNKLMALPVKSITRGNSILFMWATFPNLPFALKLIQGWGFTYKTIGFTWVKLNTINGEPFFGIGHYTKSNSEVCLIGVRGSPKIINNDVSSVLLSPKEEHSKKPNVIRSRIVRLCGDVPRIELFARQKVKGWDCWGNAVS